MTEFLVRNISIPGRFFLAPINTGLVVDGQPTDALIEFQRQRSGHEIAISYVGNVAINRDYVTNDHTPYVQDEIRWAALANAVRQSGSVAGMQVACQKSAGDPSKKWRNPDVSSFIKRERELIKSIPREEIQMIVELMTLRTMQAHSLGFSVVQLHAAHGYLLAKLLNPTLNRRTDEFGEPWHAITQVLNAISSNADRPIIDVRLSMCHGIEDPEVERSRTEKIAAHLVEAGADMISISNGMYDVNRFDIYPRLRDGHGCYVGFVEELAQRLPHIIWNVAGNIWDLARLPLQVKNLTFSLCRALIADPKFIEKSMHGRQEDVRRCVRSGWCHYFSKGTRHITCKVNPEFAKYSELLD